MNFALNLRLILKWDLKLLILNSLTLAQKQLPVDSSPDYLIQRPVPNACFHRVKPTPVDEPKLVAISEDALKFPRFPISTPVMYNF